MRRDGRPAFTGYRTLAAAAGIALLELDLATGRTDQIRVHLKHLGHPLVGRPGRRRGALEGSADARAPHAGRLPAPGPPRLRPRLAFRHPATGELAAFEAAMAEDVKAALGRSCGKPDRAVILSEAKDLGGGSSRRPNPQIPR